MELINTDDVALMYLINNGYEPASALNIVRNQPEEVIRIVAEIERYDSEHKL